jgi:hypothetical protein
MHSLVKLEREEAGDIRGSFGSTVVLDPCDEGLEGSVVSDLDASMQTAFIGEMHDKAHAKAEWLRKKNEARKARREKLNCLDPFQTKGSEYVFGILSSDAVHVR